MKRIPLLISLLCCALCLLAPQAYANEEDPGNAAMPKLEGHIAIGGIIHPGRIVEVKFEFPDGSRIDFSQRWMLADDANFTKNVTAFGNYGYFPVPNNAAGKYLRCEAEIPGYSGVVISPTFHLSHQYWMGKWQWNESEHWTKCPYCESISEKEKHTFGPEEIQLAPTCCDSGVAVRKCAKCRYEISSILPNIGHEWSEPVYLWGEDHASCIAERTCKRDPLHVERVDGVVSSEIIKPAEVGVKGKTLYRASFSQEWAEHQSIIVEDIDAIPQQDLESQPNSEASSGMDTSGADSSVSPEEKKTPPYSKTDRTSDTIPKTADRSAILFGVISLLLSISTLIAIFSFFNLRNEYDASR